jgi:hypothetical protein
MSSVKGKKQWGKDVEKQTYRSKNTFAEQMRAPTEREALAIFKKRESEFVKPYAHDDYNEMEYDFIPPNFQLRFDPLTYADYDWDRPQLESDLYPGDDVPRGDFIFFCGIAPCFCPGQTESFPSKCTYKIVSVSIVPITNTDGLFSVGNAGQKIEITASPAADDWDNFSFDINMRTPRGGQIGPYRWGESGFAYGSHLAILVTKCSDDDCCACGDVTPTITYTTQNMQVDETQNLGIAGSGSLEASCYTWSLSGGGTLSDDEGLTTTYTAPSSNDSGCSNNATITLKCAGNTVDTLEIAVNAYAGAEKAYTVGRGSTCDHIYSHGFAASPGCAQIACGAATDGYDILYRAFMDNYKCDGTAFATATDICTGSQCTAVCDGVGSDDCAANKTACEDDCNTTAAVTVNCTDTVDTRSPAMKAAGCCPGALL